MKRGSLIVATFVLTLAASLLAPSPAHAGVWRKDAVRVAKSINCKHIDDNVITGGYSYDAAACRLKKRPVTVATFRNRAQQNRWLRIIKSSPGWCVASRPGALVEPDSGKRSTARIAARRLHGRVICG